MDTGQNLAGDGYVSVSKARQATAFVFILQNVWNQMEKSSLKNLRDAHCTDIYVVSGREPQGATWAPRFVYHGFR